MLGSASTTRTPAGPAGAATPSADGRTPLLSIQFTLDGKLVEVQREDATLLDSLREELGSRAVKDGCSPQGQCGCCTVLVDGVARVSCVTPVRRVAGRQVVTAAGLEPVLAERLVGSFAAHGASQCGFCTPGILCRVAALGDEPSVEQVETALLAHLCRCTGWRPIIDATTSPSASPSRRDISVSGDLREVEVPASDREPGRIDPGPSPGETRAAIEGGSAQRVGSDVIRGFGGFADDTAPDGCAVAVPDRSGNWVFGETVAEARAAAGKVQGRRSGQELSYPIDMPAGRWDIALQTTWVEPAYLEPDSSWCEPGGVAASPAANGGAFGGKTTSLAPLAARRLADELGRPVRVVLSREDVVRLGPKRPPMAAGVRLDGTGVVRIAAAEGISDAVISAAAGLRVEEVTVPGPPVSASIRAAGWAEGAILMAVASALSASGPPVGPTGRASVVSPAGARAEAEVRVDEAGWPVAVDVAVSCGRALDEVVLRSYVTGAAHMALGWVCSEGVAVGVDGTPEDLTIRSFGILRARDTPPIHVDIAASATDPVNGSDTAFAAVAAAAWLAQGLPSRWPSRRGGRR